MVGVKTEIRCNDNLEELKKIPDGSVDLVYIDPPFNTGKDWNEYDDRWNSREHYISFMKDRLVETKRVLKDSGTMYLHVDPRESHYLKVEMDKIFGDDNFVNEIIWSYSGGGVPKNRFAPKHDTILVYGNGGNRTFNPRYIPYKTANGRHSNGKPYREEGKYLEDWWIDIPPVSTASKERTGYPTQKPEILLKRIISASSNPNDMILDFFAGSGTTCVVAKKLGRKSICIDKNMNSCKLMEERLQ